MKNPVTREIARIIIKEGGAAQIAILQVLVDLRHIARENHLLFDKAVADSAEVERDDVAGTTEEALRELYSLAGVLAASGQIEAEAENGKVEWDEVDCLTDDIIALGDNEDRPDDQQLENIANAVKDLFTRAFQYGVVKDE
jgi:hypothetical protein